jgi:hypothetical protein
LDINNLQVLCEACNIGKTNRDTTDWRQQWASGASESAPQRHEINSPLCKTEHPSPGRLGRWQYNGTHCQAVIRPESPKVAETLTIYRCRQQSQDHVISLRTPTTPLLRLNESHLKAASTKRLWLRLLEKNCLGHP